MRYHIYQAFGQTVLPVVGIDFGTLAEAIQWARVHTSGVGITVRRR